MTIVGVVAIVTTLFVALKKVAHLSTSVMQSHVSR